MFRFSMSTISRQGRSDSRSAVAAAAYRSGQQITDARSEQTWDYSPRKRDIAYSEIILPAGVSEQWKDRSFLWNSVETHNRRKDSLLAREIQLAIPAELSAEERVALIHEISQAIADEHSVAVDGNIHKPDRKKIGDERNWHAHLQFTANRFEGDALGKKAREFDAAQGGGELVEYWRAKWAAMCNGALERHGSEKRVDHRSYKRQGIDKVGVSLPYNAWRMEMSGEASLVGDLAIEREADHGGLEVENAREPRADVGTLAAPGIGTWEWANWAGEWDPWADLREPDLSLEGGVPVESGREGETLGTLVSEGIGITDAPGAGVDPEAGRPHAAVAGTLAEPVQRDLRNSPDRMEPGPAGPEAAGRVLAEPGQRRESVPDADPRLADLRGAEPGDMEPVGGSGRQLRPDEAAALASPAAPGGHQPEGKPVLPGGGPVGGSPGVRPGPVSADPLPAGGGRPVGAGPVAAAARAHHVAEAKADLYARCDVVARWTQALGDDLVHELGQEGVSIRAELSEARSTVGQLAVAPGHEILFDPEGNSAWDFIATVAGAVPQEAAAIAELMGEPEPYDAEKIVREAYVGLSEREEAYYQAPWAERQHSLLEDAIQASHHQVDQLQDRMEGLGLERLPSLSTRLKESMAAVSRWGHDLVATWSLTREVRKTEKVLAERLGQPYRPQPLPRDPGELQKILQERQEASQKAWEGIRQERAAQEARARLEAPQKAPKKPSPDKGWSH